ncbi:leucine-rich repeat domain-containing protein [Microscilla marina]|uniref:Internalin-related protein n=1 Tax=Microscilla marina ATCC 23134 TaxID=313606 RepID=A1ZX47_MICM2|nr:leucine-rich repeat domain-containing protein [Microscilla marina]EAY25028.1 internalin-related protein [Microscilla marina ATCC 23134]
MNNGSNFQNDLKAFWQNFNTEINNSFGVDLNKIAADWKNIFKSSQSWWDNLIPEWQEVFRRNIDFTGRPTEAQLKQIIYLQELDCSNAQLATLTPLSQLKYLQVLDCSSTNILSLEPLQQMTSLLKLSCYNTHVSSLKPLRKLVNMRVLHCSMTDIDRLDYLKGMHLLQELNCNSTYVKTLRPLRKLKKLQLLYCEDARLTDKTVRRFKRRHPECEVFYTPTKEREDV